MSNQCSFFFSFFSGEVAEENFALVRNISIVAVVLLVLAVVLIALLNSRSRIFKTANLATAGVCIAASFALSYAKFSPVNNGGSITIASLVPVMLYAYFFGPVSGLAVGMIFGLLQFIQEPWLLTPVSFLLDYPLPFASIFWMGIAGKMTKMKEWQRLTLGVVLTYLTRFLFHFLSGFIYFAHGAIWAELPATNAFVYSFLYQITYLGPDFAIALVAVLLLSFSKAVSAIEKIIRR